MDRSSKSFLKILYECITANTSAIWQHAAHNTDQLSSPCSWSFSNFSCNKPLCESSRDVFEKQTQETVNVLCFKTKNLIIQLIAVFLNHQTQNSLKNPAWLHLLAFEFYHCLRIQTLTWMWLMTPQCQIPLLGVSLNLRSVYLWQNIKKTPQTLKCINSLFGNNFQTSKLCADIYRRLKSGWEGCCCSSVVCCPE